jgi:PAS domain S-box-containing protein
MDMPDGGMEKILAIEESLNGMIDLHRLVSELKEMEIDQQRTIEDLQSNVDQYRTFLQNIPLRLFIKNRDLSYIYCNQSYANDLKEQPEEIIGKTDHDFFPSDLAEKFMVDDKKVLEAGALENIEDQYIVDGQDLIVHMVKAPLRDENANMVGLIGLSWDITKAKRKKEEALRHLAHIEVLISNRMDELEETSRRLQQESSERRQVEETLKQTEEIRQTIFEGTGAALAVLSEEDMIIVQANRKLEEVLGIHREEMENKKSLWEFIADGDLDRIEEQYLTIRSGSDALPAGLPGGREYRFVDQQGNGKDILVTMALIPGTGRITASFLDVTERNHLEKALKRSEEKHQGMVEKAPVAIGVIQKGAFKFINPRVIEIFGYSQEELTSQPVLEFIHTDDREMDKLLFKESNDGELPHVFFFKIVRKDGTIRWVEDRVDLIYWEGSPATINFFTDITLRKQAEDELLSSLQPFRVLIEKAQKVMTTEQGQVGPKPE